MTDNKANVPSKEELNSVIWTTVLRSVVAGNCRPLETGRGLQQLWRELFRSHEGERKANRFQEHLEKRLLDLGASPKQINLIRSQARQRLLQETADALAESVDAEERRRMMRE